MPKSAPAASPALPDDIAALSFEAAMAELENLVRRMEQGSLPLAEAVAAYERGHFLKQHCAARLTEAQLRIEQIQLKAEGAAGTTVVGTTPFNS